MPQKWGLSFDINTQTGPNGRSAGSYAWAGLLNCCYWVDPVKKVTGAVFTQLLPFYDARMVELFGAFERGLYTGLARAWIPDIHEQQAMQPLTIHGVSIPRLRLGTFRMRGMACQQAVESALALG